MNFQELTYGKKYAAIEYAENNTFNFLQLTKKKNEFVISKRQQSKYFDQVKNELKGQKHLFLIINNEQVLSKKTPLLHNNDNSVLRTAFPNIITTDFYFNTYTTENHSYIAIIRKEVVDNIISQFKEEGVSIIDFSLGNLITKNLQTFIEATEVRSSNALIEIEDKEIKSIKKEMISNEEYTINDLKISNNELLPLSGIIGYYSKIRSSTLQKELKESYMQKRFFDIGLKTSLGFLLIVLLINFLFFSQYREKVGQRTVELQLSETYKKQLNNLQKEVAQKKRLVSSVNSASNSKLSRYIDDLGLSVPNTILLSQINYQPLKGTIRADKELIYDIGKMSVRGTSKDNATFSNWISLLEKKDWIEKIAILDYGKGKKVSTMANFEFLITINE